MQNTQQTLASETTLAKQLFAAEISENSKANWSLAKFLASYRSIADVVFEDDVFRAFCIPPIYTKNFHEKHFILRNLSISEAFFCVYSIFN